MKTFLLLFSLASARGRLLLAEIELQAIEEVLIKNAARVDHSYLERKRQRAQLAVDFARAEIVSHALPFDSGWWGA